ncbi:hypothetical protein MTBLM5_50170 [Magnetospirillum sp. LM-5]|nr:hypothetical protein MTBLM5_50170 [Magnetospirillum sp. LM-5]
MLIPDRDEIMRSARLMVLRYGNHAAAIAREDIASAKFGREQDLAFLVLNEVERMVLTGTAPTTH